MPDSIPCTTCGARLKKRRDKHGKPYFVCEPCGVQLFIRRKQGIENLAKLIEQLKIHDFHFREHTHVLCEIQAVLAEMRGVKKEIKSLESGFGFFMNAKDQKEKQRTLELLELRIKHLHFRLEDLAKRGSPRRA
jgi:DNA-directed RNA polymerase subunit RPC12/RpoP